MNKRQRTAPDQWFYVSKAWNASKLAEQVTKLTDENEKLRQELAAFDMDFFEEIENLKYSHAEATKKLRAYEAAEQRGGGRGY